MLYPGWAEVNFRWIMDMYAEVNSKNLLMQNIEEIPIYYYLKSPKPSAYSVPPPLHIDKYFLCSQNETSKLFGKKICASHTRYIILCLQMKNVRKKAKEILVVSDSHEKENLHSSFIHQIYQIKLST